MDREVLTNAADLGEIIRLHNEAVERLKAFRATRPYLIAPNMVGMLEGNLKDNVEVLYRELNNLTKPRSATKQYVCGQCHSVFLQRLPGGICDECRSRSAPGSGRYGGGATPPSVAYDSRDANPEAHSAAAVADAEEIPPVIQGDPVTEHFGAGFVSQEAEQAQDRTDNDTPQA
jgi:hypothetical protein